MRTLLAFAAVLGLSGAAVAGEETSSVQVTIKGMTCPDGCGASLTKALQGLDGVKEVKLADFEKGLFTLSVDAAKPVKPSAIKAKVGKFEMPSRAYLGRFNFKGTDQQKKVGNLSGGERGRLHLAKMMMSGGNVLLLDEPSNDLDVETLRALEDALSEFAGSALVISHDRWFLDRIATHILAAEDNSKWVFFEGNYQEYEADKRKRLGEEGARPHRPRFKPLH